jgi:hypothetical protein
MLQAGFAKRLSFRTGKFGKAKVDVCAGNTRVPAIHTPDQRAKQAPNPALARQ